MVTARISSMQADALIVIYMNGIWQTSNDTCFYISIGGFYQRKCMQTTKVKYIL